jgi:thymidylate synthase (FAD)
MKVTLIRHTHEPLRAIASAAAITQGIPYDEVFGWTEDKIKSLVMHCYNSGHWSIFEFADFDFEVQGVSRAFETQCVRSRLASYEWESGRRDQEYKICDTMKHNALINTEINDGITVYEMLVKDEVPPEKARYALPQGVARKARIKRNFRNLMETSLIRLCSHAMEEYREFMWLCKDEVKKVEPFLADLLVPECEYLGYCKQTKGCCHRNGVMQKSEALCILKETTCRN